MFEQFKITKRTFAANEDGAVAAIFGLTSLALVMVTGLAIDVGRVIHAESKLASAADAAVLAAAKALKEHDATEAEIRQIADRYFTSNMAGGGNYATVNGINVIIDRDRNSVSLDIDASVRTTFGQIAGLQSIAIPKVASATYDSKEVEIALQLDVTGSMRGRKLRDLKDAVAGDNGLIDIMLPASRTTNKVRIGLAPYASGVNAGPYAAAVSGGRATNGCVYERISDRDQADDVAPTNSMYRLKAVGDLGLRSPGGCPRDAQITPITNDRHALIDSVESWDASGATAGHLGTAWAWYLVSPEWSSVWPASATPVDYGTKDTLKVVVLMTDGIYNTVGGSSDGDSGSTAQASARFATDTCAAMKAKGVVVYTVGFQVPDSAKPTLETCASDASKFYDATDGANLKASFRAIAAEISNLRLAR